MLDGIDISHHQGSAFSINTDFCIMKISEGKTWRDGDAATFISQCITKRTLMGLYHYARPEYNADAAEEATAFVEQIHILEKETEEILIGQVLLALDWEGVAWSYPIAWALEWLDTVLALTGVRPVLYCHYTKVHDADIIAANNYGLWITYWGVNDGSYNDKALDCGEWYTWALRQYTSKPLDRNKFNGTAETWQKFCDVQGEEPIEPEPIEPEPIEFSEIAKITSEIGQKFLQLSALFSNM